jgi:hypothetical protein
VRKTTCYSLIGALALGAVSCSSTKTTETASNGSGGFATGGFSQSGSGGDGGMTTGTGGITSGAGGNDSGGTDTGGNATGGASGAGAGGDITGTTSGTGGATDDSGAIANCGAAAAVVTYPTLPGAVQSPLYTVTANGTSQFVEKITKYSPEMQVHYANFAIAGGCTAAISVTVSESFASYTVSPLSKNIAATANGNAITFSSGPNYLILQFDSKELLFILIDEQESNPPQLGDSNVKNLADYNADNTGATLATSTIQSAIDAASGATQNILYVPPGKYKVGELWLKSDMTLYLAAGTILYGSDNSADFTSGAGGLTVENCSHGVVHMNNISNTKILGRGVIDGNGTTIRGHSNDTPSTKLNVVKIDQSSNILIDGILVRDPVFWNTLIFKSNEVTIQNYKVINCRPTTTAYNQTDGVDFDASTNGHLYNAFLYTGDDNMAVKTEENAGMDTLNIVHEKVVLYSNSAGCKIGTKTYGNTMDGIVFKDIDVVKAGRAMAIDANDTAVIQNTSFENIRIEAADSNLIDIEEDRAPTWRTCPNLATVKAAYFTDVASNVNRVINLHGKSSSVSIDGVHFSNLTVQGAAVTSQTSPNATWDINSYVTNITF